MFRGKQNAAARFRVTRVSVVVAIALAAVWVSGCEDSSDTKSPAVYYAYVSGSSNGQVSGYLLDPEAGTLTEMESSPFNGNANVGAMHLSPDGRTVLIEESSGTTAALKTLDPQTGALGPVADGLINTGGSCCVHYSFNPEGTLIYGSDDFIGDYYLYDYDADARSATKRSGAPFGAPGTQQSIVVEPGGDYAYAPNQTGLVYSFKVNANSGKLTPTPGVSVSIGSFADRIAMDPNGKYVFVTENSAPTLYSLRIKSSNGDLVVADSAAISAGLGYLAVHPEGTYVYVSESFGQRVFGYAVDASNGSLSKISGSPFKLLSSGSLQDIEVTPDGQYLMAVEQNQSVALLFTIDGSGALSDSAVTAADTVGSPRGILIVDPEQIAQ